MCANHNNYIEDCLECIKESSYSQYFDRLSYMYEDNAEGNANEYLDGKLVAIKPMNVYSRPTHPSGIGGSVLRSVKPGEYVGDIYSWKIQDGVTWWQLDDGKGFVKHGVGIFDKSILEKSIADKKAVDKKELDEAIKKRLDSNENPFYNTGKTLENLIPDFDTIKWILIAILALVVLTMIYKILK